MTSKRLRDLVAAIDDTQREIVPVPEWTHKGQVPEFEIRSLTQKERGDMTAAQIEAGGAVTVAAFYPQLIVHCAYDPETSELAFEPSDVEMLMTKSGSAIETLGSVAARLSGFTPKSVDEAKSSLSEAPDGGSPTP